MKNELEDARVTIETLSRSLSKAEQELTDAHKKLSAYDVGFLTKNLSERIDALLDLHKAEKEFEEAMIVNTAEVRVRNAALKRELDAAREELEKLEAARWKPEPSRLEIAAMLLASEHHDVKTALRDADALIVAAEYSKK
jgi:hypothetical protein